MDLTSSLHHLLIHELEPRVVPGAGDGHLRHLEGLRLVWGGKPGRGAGPGAVTWLRVLVTHTARIIF